MRFLFWNALNAQVKEHFFSNKLIYANYTSEKNHTHYTITRYTNIYYRHANIAHQTGRLRADNTRISYYTIEHNKPNNIFF